jgi:hypothetical protein
LVYSLNTIINHIGVKKYRKLKQELILSYDKKF